MKLELQSFIVNNEVDIVDGGIDKVLANISILINVIGANTTNTMVAQIDVISLNTDTGVEMDLQRLAACENYILKY